MDILKDEPYDRYRNLEQVWSFPDLQGKFDSSNTLLIDSDDKKVQLCLDNAITNRPYGMHDVQSAADENDGVVRGKDWQI